MATYKQVTLKDPKTGDYLIPRVYGTLSYQLVNGEITPPFDPQLDAYTLQGHPASYFATANHTHTQYAASSHNHEIANINGLQSELDEVKTSVSEGKALIAAAVTDKGVSTAADATFQQMATNIGKISQGPSTVNISASFYSGSNPPSAALIIMYTDTLGNYRNMSLSRTISFTVFKNSPIFIGTAPGEGARYGISLEVLSGTGNIKGCPIGTTVLNVITFSTDGSFRATARTSGFN